jgi:putative flippase GtrA
MVSKDTFWKFVRFSVVGFINTAASYLAFFILLEVGHVPYLLSSILAYLLSILISYIGNKYWTFKTSATALHVEFIKFFILNMIGLAINTALMAFLVEIFNVHPLVAQILAMAVVIFYNFFGSKHWVFREN